MSAFRFALPLALAAFATLAGCSTEAGEELGADESALTVSAEYLGPILNGRTKIARYDVTPPLQAYGFMAKGGDHITISVRSPSGTGDPVAYIAGFRNNNDQLEVLAENDNASFDTRDAAVSYDVPAGTPLSHFRAVFRDRQLSPSTLYVKLSMRGNGAPSCTYLGQSYAAGDEFAAAGNECNMCTCSTTGRVTCSSNACVCDPSQEPWRTYYGTPDQCPTLGYDCPAGENPFLNSCGCGCERPH